MVYWAFVLIRNMFVSYYFLFLGHFSTGRERETVWLFSFMFHPEPSECRILAMLSFYVVTSRVESAAFVITIKRILQVEKKLNNLKF